MIQVKCIQKFRDKNNNIYGYRLQDANGQLKDIKSHELKQAIASGSIQVVNLILTSDGRLISKESTSNKNSNELAKKTGKAMMGLELSIMDMGDSLYDVVQDICYAANDDIDTTEAEELFKDDPRFKGCKWEQDILIRLGELEYSNIAIKEPKKIQEMILMFFSNGNEEYIDKSDPDVYKAFSVLREFGRQQGLNKLEEVSTNFLKASKNYRH